MQQNPSKNILPHLCWIALLAWALFPFFNQANAQTRAQNAQIYLEKVLPHEKNPLMQTDPEFMQIKNAFVFNDIPKIIHLNEKTRFLIQIVTLTVTQNLNHLPPYIKMALNSGVLANEIKEAIYQTAPYIGIEKTESALLIINPIIQNYIIHLPLLPQSKTNDQTRFEKGKEKQIEIFGKKNTESMEQNTILNLLSSYCFGDFYTRGVLDLKTRELLTFAILVALGDAQNQIQEHIQGNFNLGNTQQNLMDTLFIMLPHIGFPRIFNALSLIQNFEKK